MSDVMKGAGYGTLLTELKTHIHTAQYTALRAESGEKSGFSGRNLWYMRTFYREYKEQPNLQPLAGEIAWTKNTLILHSCSPHASKNIFIHSPTHVQ